MKHIVLILALLSLPRLLGATTLTTISFTNPNTQGDGPQGGVVQGSDGNFYGTTEGGGSHGSGNVFKMTSGGVLTSLFSFTGGGANSSSPRASLIQGNDGNLYGTTYENSTVFEINSSGTLTTLASLKNMNASDSLSSLIEDNQGNFYGTTYNGGSTSNYGTVFELSSSGTLSILASFTGTNGEYSYAGLTLGNDGNYYGTTANGGGSGNVGTVFKITPAGNLTTVVSFPGTGGYYPEAGVIQGTDTNFYGTTFFGGTSGYGTVFKLTQSRALTTLVNFNGANGQYPSGQLVEGNDGNFYGTTQNGGTTFSGGTYSGYGTVFEVTASGTLTTLVSFTKTNGQQPFAGLIQGSDGNLYGTTIAGGSNNLGTVFQLNTTTSDNVSFSSSTTIPITTSDYAINGSALNLNLVYAPVAGTVLTVIHNTGTTPINGTFTNLPNGGTITATYNGIAYAFTANYSGGAGYDLTLTLTSTGSDTPTMPWWGLTMLGMLLMGVAIRMLPRSSQSI